MIYLVVLMKSFGAKYTLKNWKVESNNLNKIIHTPMLAFILINMANKWEKNK